MDSITAVLADFSGNQPKIIDFSETHYTPNTLKKIQQIVEPNWQGALKDISEADNLVGREFAIAAKHLISRNPDYQPSAIGSHGQTIFHEPDTDTASSWQIGDPNIIAEITNTPTIADWRRRDLAAGGQGAPLVPAFHHAFFASNSPTLILNLGGIANLTLLTDSEMPPQGFDTGPANTLLDLWASKHTSKNYDKNGEWAATGNTSPALLQKMLSDPYFKKTPPKSTGREYFNLDWLNRILSKNPHQHQAQDIQATLTELTVASIGNSISALDCANVKTLYVCGGGAHNSFLMERLKQHLHPINIQTTETKGINPDLVESLAFAWLAQRTLNGLTGNSPSSTGSSGHRILGGIYQ